MNLVRYPILVLLLSFLTLSTIHAEPFAKIRLVEGVRDVYYEAPFLFVISKSLVDVPRIRIELGEIEKENSDPDLVALNGAYNVRVYNSDSYRVHLRDQSLARRANSIPEMKELFRRARFGTIVSLDWESETTVQSRDRYSSKLAPPDEAILLAHDQHLDAIVARLKKTGKKPDQLIFLEFFSVGRLVFPVSNGKVYANGKKISYKTFLSGLPEPL